MLWLTIAILAYFLFALVFLADKYLLGRAVANPKVYTFYNGSLMVLAALLIPFVDFDFPGFWQLFLSLSSGLLFVWGIFWFFKGLQLFEASRLVPAVGGALPIFTFLLVLAISRGQTLPSPLHIFALMIIIAGSVLVSLEKGKKISLESFKTSLLPAFLFSVSFVLIKYVYLGQPFWQGFIWIAMGGFFGALLLLFSKEVRNSLFQARRQITKKTALVFFSKQIAGGSAFILQNWAIALAPLAFLAVINALQGMQYVFLLFFAVLLSVKFPQILKEEVSKEVILQKTAAILLIGAGLILLAF